MRKVHPPRHTWASCARGGAWLPVRAGPRCHPHPAAQDSPDCGGFEWLRASALPREGGGVRRCHPPRAAARPVGPIAAPRRRAARRHPSRHPPVSGVTLYATSGALVSSRAALRANSDPRATSAPPATRITRWVWPDALVRFAPQERCCGQHGDDSDCAGCGAGV